MPVTWGSSPAPLNTATSTDIAQFTKWFTLMGLDFEMMHAAGLWTVTAWNNEIDQHLVFASSGKQESLSDGLIACYVAAKAKLKSNSQ